MKTKKFIKTQVKVSHELAKKYFKKSQKKNKWENEIKQFLSEFAQGIFMIARGDEQFTTKEFIDGRTKALADKIETNFSKSLPLSGGSGVPNSK